VPLARVALAWLLHQPAITAPIVGASKLSHLDDAVGALDITLSAEEVAYLEEPYVPHPLVGIVPFR
jgi:aryl-alcohol dehydrogenase-like predicted oxidoreductase